MAAGDRADVELMAEAAVHAGAVALTYFRSDPQVWTKAGNSPVTSADLEVDRILREALLEARPDYGWLSEESEDDEGRLTRSRTFIVDPIDGTRGFIDGSDQWCICAAVVENGRPVAAVIHCPALEETYAASSGGRTLLNGTAITAGGGELSTIAGPRKLGNFLNERQPAGPKAHPFVPSLAYRIALTAKGDVDAALASPGAHDWDLAAADLILHAAGGRLTGPRGDRLRYNRRKLRRDALFASAPGRHEALMALAKSAGFLK